MRSRTHVLVVMFAILASACGGSAAGSGSPGIDLPPPAPSQPGLVSLPAESDPGPLDSTHPTPEATASPAAARVIILHGTFTGHYSGMLATADQAVEVEVRWNAGPDDIHDRDAFALTSGTFTFSETIDGVCGGVRTESGPMTSHVNAQSLFAADPPARDNALVQVTDQRLNLSGVQFAVSSLYEVPNADPVGCGDLDRSGVGTCPLVFLQTAIGELEQDATCTAPAGAWVGHLQP